MVTFEQLKLLEKYLDQAWKMLGIDVSFTKHFLERANDPRNGKPIDIRELQKLFVDAYKRYGSIFARMKLGDNEIEGVLIDLSTKINSPFVLSWDKRSREFDLRAKTVMRKNNFVPNNPREKKYTVEDRYTDKLKEKGYTVAISQAKYSELNKQFKALHEEQERKQMSLNKRFGVSDEFAKIANEIAEETYKQREEEAKALAEASKAKMAELLGESKQPAGDDFLTRSYKQHANVDGHDVYHNGRTYLIQKNGKDAWNRLRAEKRIDLVKKAHAQWKTNEDVEHEDVEQIDELSKKTLGSYVKKASHDVATKSAATGRYGERSKVAQDKYKAGDYSVWQQGKKDDETADKFFKKSWKRREGISKAVDKLTKEDSGIDEAFDNGPGDKRAAEIKKELDASVNKKKTFKEKFKRFRQDLHYATNVSKLPKHLQDDVQEDVEQIDELSQDTLKSYIPKASKSVDKLQIKRNVAGSESGKDPRNYEKRKEHEKLDSKVRTRSRGILNAIRKIPEDTDLKKKIDEDCLKVNIPLLIRLLEFAREDAKDDVALHKAVERMTKLSENGKKELTMTDYSSIMEDCGVLSEISSKTLMSYRTKADRDRMETWGKKENSYKTILKQKNAYNLAKASGKEDEAAAVKKRFDKTNANFKAQGKHIEKRANGIRMADMKISRKWREENKLKGWVKEDEEEGKKKINEGNPLSRLTTHDKKGRVHSIVMTAERHNLTKKENSARMKELKKSFREKGYGFRNTQGKWDEGSGTQTEKSIHVYAKGPGNKHAGELVRHARELSKKYDQDAFLHRSAKGTGTASYTKPGSEGKKDRFGKTKFNTDNPYGETEYRASKPEGHRPKFTFK